jgi:tetratricopeptide (TPR) repeat protein
MSLNNYKKAHEIYEKLNVPREMSIVSFNIGLISLYHLKDEREAVKHLESAIKGFKEKNDEKRVKKAEELLSIVNKKE